MSLNREQDTLVFTYEDDDGEEIVEVVPSNFEVCTTCGGKGQHSLAVDGHGITEEERERDWDTESWEGYLNGAYDRTCEECKGLRVTLEPNWKAMTEEMKSRIRDWQEDEAEYEALCAAERRMGC